MTRQEAIQEQIDDIMDTFDFNSVHAWMVHTNWVWGDNGVPDISEIRREARRMLRDAARSRCVSTGGFTAWYHEGTDESGPWLKLDLNFGLNTYNDGISYTK